MDDEYGEYGEYGDYGEYDRWDEYGYPHSDEDLGEYEREDGEEALTPAEEREQHADVGEREVTYSGINFRDWENYGGHISVNRRLREPRDEAMGQAKQIMDEIKKVTDKQSRAILREVGAMDNLQRYHIPTLVRALLIKVSLSSKKLDTRVNFTDQIRKWYPAAKSDAIAKANVLRYLRFLGVSTA